MSRLTSLCAVSFFLGSLIGLTIFVAACTPAERATATQDAKKALDVACQARALEKASEPDAGAK